MLLCTIQFTDMICQERWKKEGRITDFSLELG